MSERILITGGAGFIGSHLTDQLLNEGYEVRILDCLHPQVHGEDQQPPRYLNRHAELLIGDVCDAAMVERALRGVDSVVHLAARVGVGQSMYEINDYVVANASGCAVLLEALIRQPVRRLVVASSMSLYGEGLYRTAQGQLVNDARRSPAAVEAGRWELTDDAGQPLTPIPTPETKQPELASVYALTKYDQERLCLITGQAYNIPAVALRFFNVYGPRQALSNPYTGVLAIFANRLLNNRPPKIFEDGQQRRDFVSVHDIARACRLALTSEQYGKTYNIGSGAPRSIEDVAHHLAAATNKTHIEPQITGEYRVGDIRHCFADITLAQAELGYQPQVAFDEGLAELAQWLEHQESTDHVDQAYQELAKRGLTV